MADKKNIDGTPEDCDNIWHADSAIEGSCPDCNAVDVGQRPDGTPGDDEEPDGPCEHEWHDKPLAEREEFCPACNAKRRRAPNTGVVRIQKRSQFREAIDTVGAEVGQGDVVTAWIDVDVSLFATKEAGSDRDFKDTREAEAFIEKNIYDAGKGYRVIKVMSEFEVTVVEQSPIVKLDRKSLS